MRYSDSKKAEIIRLVERSKLSVCNVATFTTRFFDRPRIQGIDNLAVVHHYKCEYLGEGEIFRYGLAATLTPA